jgi:RNA polymerase sigma-70 factor (ECF subfamily)
MIAMDGTALAEVFDAHAAALVLYARNWLDAAAAEDVVQEAFVRLAGGGHRPENVRAWLLTCVRNAALDALRGHKRQIARERAAGEARLFARGRREPEALPVDEVEAALRCLGPVEREVIVLRIWNGATFEEIAALVRLPLSTVYARYRAGLELMRARWEEPCRKP